jgi:hypothetical protein
MMKNLKKRVNSREDRFKTLFALSRYSIAKDDGSKDILSRSWMHVDERDEVVLAAQQRRRRKPRCVGDSWLFVVTRSMVAARIYREDWPRVTTSRNRVDLSLSKRIRHGLVAKINDKRKPRTCEALGRILMDYSCAHRALAPIASPRLTTPCPVWQGEVSEHARVFFFFSSPPLTCKCIESNPHFKYTSLHLH